MTVNSWRFPIHPLILEKLERDIQVFFEEEKFFNWEKAQVESLTEDFLELYPSRPLEKNPGGCDIKPCYWLYLIAKRLSPTLIVESGIWKGQTLWLWRRACPDAVIHGFDIDLKNLEYRDTEIFYHRQDWNDSQIRCTDPDKSLVFFDDHINQARRIHEAHSKGFKWLIFDDNVGPREFYKIGVPPAPTIRMLLDRSLEKGTIITWQDEGREHSYIYREQDCYNARHLIDDWVEFPTSTNLTLVKLKNHS
jgi:hypothetical protein